MSSLNLLSKEYTSDDIRSISVFPEKGKIIDTITGIIRHSDGYLYVSDLTRIYKLVQIPESESIYSGHNNTKYHQCYIAVSIAGSCAGYKDGKGHKSMFRSILDIVSDKKNSIYVVDGGNYCIRQVIISETSSDSFTNEIGAANSVNAEEQEKQNTTEQEQTFSKKIKVSVVTLCGKYQKGWIDGTLEEAQFSSPVEIAYQASSEELYVTENHDNLVRKISLRERIVSTIGGNRLVGYTDKTNDYTNSVSVFNYPNGITVDKTGRIYVCDTKNNCVRVINPDSNATTCTILGTSIDGYTKRFCLESPLSITLDESHRSILLFCPSYHGLYHISIDPSTRSSERIISYAPCEEIGDDNNYNRPFGSVIKYEGTILRVLPKQNYVALINMNKKIAA